MIEKVILDYLKSALPVPVYMEVPEKPPASFVLVEKTSSGRENHINSAMIALQSYATSLYGAASLNEAVKTAMDNSITTKDISAAKLNSDYNYTDTATKQYRYQAVYDIFY